MNKKYHVNIIHEDVHTKDRYVKTQLNVDYNLDLFRRNYVDSGYKRYEPTETETTFPIPDTLVYVKSINPYTTEYVYVSETLVDFTNVIFNMKEHNDNLWYENVYSDGVVYKRK